jgi:hypothetical protein
MFVVDVRDPLGRRVVMDDATMHGHIGRRHPEMVGHEADIATAVACPVAIYETGATRNAYVGCNGWWVEVIVEHRLAVYGVVVTAWRARNRPVVRGRLIWPPPS